MMIMVVIVFADHNDRKVLSNGHNYRAKGGPYPDSLTRKENKLNHSIAQEG